MTEHTSHLFYQARLERPVLDKAKGIYMWDINGKRYIDGSSGAMVSNIGHSHPYVLEAMMKQMEKATFGYRLHFETEPSEQLAVRTARLSPEGLNRVFFVSGGSEAVESAIKLARQYVLTQGQSQRYKIISRFPSYHGSTLGALSLTGYTSMTSMFDPMMKASAKIPAPVAYLDGLDIDDPATGLYYADKLEEEIIRQGAETVLAFVVEPIGGASTGALVPPAGYMQRIRNICNEYDVLLIHDEVMTGGGRSGRFFAADHWQVAPDITVLSKGFAAGYAPLGAMIAHERIVEAVLDDGGFNHGYTYAGNPLACSAALAVLDVIETENLIENAAAMGRLLAEKLEDLKFKYPFIGDVRGKGLLLAFEMVADRATMQPLDNNLSAYARLVEIAYQNGLIIYSRRTRGGNTGDHFLVCPPMVINEDQIKELMDLLILALDQFARETGLDTVNAA